MTEPNDQTLIVEIRNLIADAKQQAATAVNTTLTHLYWQIGRRINQELLGGERADYGKQIVATLARQLTQEFGRGFSEKQLRRMMQFSEAFPQPEIVATIELEPFHQADSLERTPPAGILQAFRDVAAGLEN